MAGTVEERVDGVERVSKAHGKELEALWQLVAGHTARLERLERKCQIVDPDPPRS